MADAAIGATIQVVLETVLSLANDRIGQVLGFRDELERLSKTAKRIQGLVADADHKKHSPGVLDWLKDLEGEVFKAENLLDEVNYEYLRRGVKYRSELKRKVCFFFSFFSTIGFRSRMASKIRVINTNLERINREANEIGLVFRCQLEAVLPVPAPSGAATSRQTDSVVVQDVVGRANDESKIVEMLLSPVDKVVSVIPIFGMAGVGKTTLAKSIYNNAQIDEHFDEKGEKGKKVWVCVAKEIKIEELFKLILESLWRKKVELDNNREAIVQDIKNEIEGKRCLLVLDDVWNKDQNLWDDFFNTLKGLETANGSCCLVTTRLVEVANIISRLTKMNDCPYKLEKLTDDDCWSIIKGKVIAGEEIPNEFEAIKKQILRRCGGLPLAATLFGSLLLTKRKEEWPSIVKKSLLDGVQNGVDQILKVSFDHLSLASAKKCFAYCSIFSQDTKLEKDQLIELWMAEGFLQPDPKSERLMEDIGDKYFRILLQNSVLEKVEGWRITYYKMHDLVHDFAKSTLNQDRYLTLDSFEGMAEDSIKKNTKSLRTLFLKTNISGDVLSKFECLHVLKLSGEDVKVLPASIGKLIHLRVLDISDSGITILPESLCKLYNLQTLRIEDDKLEKGLPKQMSNLISLRHLHYFCGTDVAFQMPSEMGQLTRLQTLKFFNIGQEDGRGIEELGSLKYLKGSLEIRNLELVNGKEGAEGAKLFEKPNLSNLKFLWGSKDRESDTCDENVLEGLQPHQNLQKLEIRNFMGDQFPGWFINLSTLVKLEFIDCKRCKELPALGQLPSLERLELRGLENIRSIGLSFYGISSGGGGGGGEVVVMSRKFFPALNYLSLKEMRNLVEWKDEGEVRSSLGAAEVVLFPVLERLNIKKCSQLTSAPSHFPSIEELDISDNCHVSLLEKIASSIITLLSLELHGNMLADAHNDKHIESLCLEKRRHSNNLEEDVECCLRLTGCGSVPSETLEHLCHLPSLRDLEFIDFSNLTRFSIWGCPRVNKLGGRGHKSFVFKSLEKLEISGCPELTSLPTLELCASLRKLLVYNCPNLVSFPLDLRQTPSLEVLHLSDCPKLMIADMPKGFAFLTNLRKLTIGPFSTNETDEFDWSGLIASSSSTLTVLRFIGLSHVESLPEQLQYLTSLTDLRFNDFGIEALPDWIGNFASLEQLWLRNCKKLRYLPSIAVRRRLTKLMCLYIDNCPLSEERCNPQSGTDSEWPIRIGDFDYVAYYPSGAPYYIRYGASKDSTSCCIM